MSPILSTLGCDRVGCQQKSNGDEASWWALRQRLESELWIIPFCDEMKLTPTESYRFFCGQACALAEISDWMAKQRKE